ncbi:MAG: hypothetical protein J6386_20810 [Candidatus Synoicihabitans palmerolidicus]|nr:hypothetical protein [Candidatus Synoicihabitans palmerolidicus]
MVNLVSNAVKFTQEGRVEVWSGARARPECYEVAVEVIDTGPGIAEEDQAQLFRAFSRLSPASDMEGAGLEFGDCAGALPVPWGPGYGQ